MVKESKKEALSVFRLINEVLVNQLSIPFKQVVNDTTFQKYTGSKRPDLLISEFEYDLDKKNDDQFINNLVAYAEVKDDTCVGDDVAWKDGITQGKGKAQKLGLPYFIVTNCKTTIFYNAKNGKEIQLNGNSIREFQTIDILRLIKNKLKKDPNITNIPTSVDSISVVSEAVFNKKLWELAKIYRNINFDNNVQKIDFTIGFISLEYFEELEKLRGILDAEKLYWSNCISPKPEQTVAKLSKYIGRLEHEQFGEFSNLMEKVKIIITGTEKKEAIISEDAAQQIYQVIDLMKPLHGCGFDLFGAVYEMFADAKEKKEFGQYFTRRHYTHIFAKLLLENEKFFNKEKRFTILDPACGTGGFLTEGFKILRNTYLSTNTLNKSAENFLANDCFWGIDVKSENISRTKLNMFLVGDGHTHMKDFNTLTEWKFEPNQKWNYILTNPPVGAGTIKANTSIISSSRTEVAFLYRVISLLEDGGRACVLLPDGVLENPQFIKLRKDLFEKIILEAVISLPKFAFAPYTKEKMYAVFFTKKNEKNTKVQKDSIWMYIIDNDGLANSDKRFPTKLRNNKNGWMHDEISGWVSVAGEEKIGVLEERWKSKYDDFKTIGTEWLNENGETVKLRKGGNISIQEISNNMFFSLLPETYLRNTNRFDYDIKGKESVKTIFKCQSGNPNITEFFIYNHIQNEGKNYSVLSSAIEDVNLMGKIKLTPKEEETMKTFDDKYGIQITRLGKAGHMVLLKKGHYIQTDKAYIIYLKEEAKNENGEVIEKSGREILGIKTEQEETDFYKWFILSQQPLVEIFKTSSDNASWNKDIFFESAYIKIPERKEITEFAKRYDELMKMKNDVLQLES